MRAFYELKNNKVLSTTYTTYPSYTVFMSGDMGTDLYSSSSAYYLYENAPLVIGRSFFDAYGNYRTGSTDFSGSIFCMAKNYPGADTANYFSATIRLKNIYASASFLKPQNYSSSSLTYSQAMLMNIPSILYGTEIKPGSFYFSATTGDVPAISDDGYGGLYDRDGRLYGSILYQHGMVLFAQVAIDEALPGAMSNWIFGFSGTYKIPMNIYLLDIPKGEGNFSTNSSYTLYDTGSTQQRLAITRPKTYITTIGLYNADYELVGVVKMSTPMLHDEKISGQVRAKLVF